MLIEARVAERMRGRRVVLRLSSSLPVRDLADLCLAALYDMDERWAANPPVYRPTGARILEPDTWLAVLPAAVILEVNEIVDGAETYRRLFDALAGRLPEHTVVEVVEPIRSRADKCQPRGGFLELRVAVEATRPTRFWTIDPEIGHRVDDMAHEWLLGVGPAVTVEYELMANGPILIEPTSLRELLRIQRQGAYSKISVVSAQQVRAISCHNLSAHVSLITGVRGDRTADWDWPGALDTLTEVFGRLEPYARNAFIRYTDLPLGSCAIAHAGRGLHRIPNRRHLNSEDERQLEETGPVDAQGIHSLPRHPGDLPPGWTCQPFGHLYRVQAPNLQAWFAQPPTEDTLAAGRPALHTLLQETLQK